jgi:pseudouridylate synthase
VQSTYIFRLRPAIDHALALRLNTRGVDIGGVLHRDFQFHHFTGGRSRHAIRVKVQAPEPRPGERVVQPVPVTQMLEALQRRVVRGGRVSFGPFTLAGLPPGGVREVTVPSFFMKYVGAAWMPFVERDWPYFRRARVQKLMRVARWRHLNDREAEEVEAFSCDELRAALARSGSEIEDEAQRFAAATVTEPAVDVPFRPGERPNSVFGF